MDVSYMKKTSSFALEWGILLPLVAKESELLSQSTESLTASEVSLQGESNGAWNGGASRKFRGFNGTVQTDTDVAAPVWTRDLVLAILVIMSYELLQMCSTFYMVFFWHSCWDLYRWRSGNWTSFSMLFPQLALIQPPISKPEIGLYSHGCTNLSLESNCISLMQFISRCSKLLGFSQAVLSGNAVTWQHPKKQKSWPPERTHESSLLMSFFWVRCTNTKPKHRVNEVAALPRLVTSDVWFRCPIWSEWFKQWCRVQLTVITPMVVLQPLRLFRTLFPKQCVTLRGSYGKGKAS